jgi:hypothetical protein
VNLVFMHFSVVSFIKILDRTLYMCESLNESGSVKADKVQRHYRSTTTLFFLNIYWPVRPSSEKSIAKYRQEGTKIM